MNTERILLFIPAYNCERQLQRVIAQIHPDLARHLTQIIVVDNRSRDSTQATAVAAFKSMPSIPSKVLLNDANYGLGGSHKVAFNYAITNGFEYCIVLHGDDQASLSDLMPLIEAGHHRNRDCLLGARFMPGSRLRGYSRLRRVGNLVFNYIFSVLSRKHIYDLGSGLNVYRVASLADKSYLRYANDLTFNYQMLLHSIAANWRIEFFPIEWREADQISNVKLVRQTLRLLKIAVDYAVLRRRYLPQDRLSEGDVSFKWSIIFDNETLVENVL